MTRKTNQGGQSPSSSSPTSISLTSSQLFRISLFEIYTVFKQQIHSPQDDVFWDMNMRRADSLLLIGGEAEHLVFSPGSDNCWCLTRLRGWYHCPCYCSDPDYIPHHYWSKDTATLSSRETLEYVYRGSGAESDQSVCKWCCLWVPSSISWEQ